MFLINCHLLREGFRASEIVSITNFVIVSSVGITRGSTVKYFLCFKFIIFVLIFHSWYFLMSVNVRV